MSEVTIAEPLSGFEIVESIKERIGEALARDCHLNPALAYTAFTAEITIWIKVKDSGREPEIHQTVRVDGGDLLIKDMSAVRSQLTIPERPPNAVRQAAGLPVPTLVEEPSGRKEVRPVRYAKKTEPPPTQEPEPATAPEPEPPAPQPRPETKR